MDDKTKALVERLINAATMHRKHPCEVYDMVALANEAAATLRAQAEEIERLKKLILSEPAGHDKPCYYCGELTSSIAGNSARWPVPLCHKEEPGKVAWHHIGCVMKKLREGEAAEAKLAALQSTEIERLAKERDNWTETARLHCKNEMYYRGLCEEIGKLFGWDACRSDDGSLQQDVICLKVPELVKKLFHAHDAAEAELVHLRARIAAMERVVGWVESNRG